MRSLRFNFSDFSSLRDSRQSLKLITSTQISSPRPAYGLLTLRLSPFESYPPTQRTAGGSGVGGAVGDIPAVPVATGVGAGMGVSSVRSTSDENWKASAVKATRNGSDRLRDRCFISSAFGAPQCAIRIRFDSQGVSYRCEIVQPNDFGQIASFLSMPV